LLLSKTWAIVKKRWIRLRNGEILYLQNLVPDILRVGDKLVLIVNVVVDDDEGLLRVLEVVLLGPLSNQGNTVLLDEGDDLFVSGRLLTPVGSIEIKKCKL